MYLPQHFAETRLEELHGLINHHPLGTLVAHTAAGLDANHLPFELDATRGSCGTLLAHIARANPLWTELPQGSDVQAIFHGPHGYISPNWYPSKHETHRQVPTWNYEVVHAHGRIRLIDDVSFIAGVVARLTRKHEATEPRPWKMADASRDYIEQSLANLIGIEIELTRVIGKRKLSQNREPRDLDGAIGKLQERGQHELASAMSAGRPDVHGKG